MKRNKPTNQPTNNLSAQIEERLPYYSNQNYNKPKYRWQNSAKLREKWNCRWLTQARRLATKADGKIYSLYKRNGA